MPGKVSLAIMSALRSLSPQPICLEPLLWTLGSRSFAGLAIYADFADCGGLDNGVQL